MLNRREATIAVLVGLAVPTASRAALAQAAAFAEAAKLVGLVADALASIAKNVPIILQSGYKTLDIVKARASQAEMLELSRSLAILNARKQTVIESMDDYAVNWHRRFPNGNRDAQLPSGTEFPADWAEIRISLTGLLERARSLLSKLENNTTKLVTQDVYSQLMRPIQARTALLPVISALPVPYQTEEVAEFEKLTARYKRLSDELQKASSALNAYIRSLDG